MLKSIAAAATMLLAALLLPAYGEERRPAHMGLAWKADWNICDVQGAQPAPLVRIQACTRIIALGEAGNPNQTVYGFAFSDRASAYYDAGLYSKALADFDKSIDYRSATHAGESLLSFVYLARARCFLKMGQFEKAAQDVDASAERWRARSSLEDTDDWQRELRGDIAYARGDYANAIRYYDSESQSHPDQQELARKRDAARELASRKATTEDASPAIPKMAKPSTNPKP